MSVEQDTTMDQEGQESTTKIEQVNEQNNGKTDDSKDADKNEDKSSPAKSTPKKTPKKRKMVDTEEEEEEVAEDEENSDEELALGSIEGPVKIMTGKRERKKTERLVFEEKKTPQDKIVKIQPGKGTKLGEIPNVSHFLNKTNAEYLKPVNQLLFGFAGKLTMVKKNIRQFSGYDFDKADPQYKKKEARLFKFTLVGLKELCLWFDLERGGSKEQIIARILEFLLKPEPSGRALPEKKKKVTGKKRKLASKKEGSGSGDSSPKKKAKKQKKSEDEQTDEDVLELSDDSVSSLSPDSDSEEVEEPKKKKPKIQKKTTKKPAPSPKKSATPSAKNAKEKKTITPKKTDKKTPVKKATSTKKVAPKKKTPRKPASADSSDSSDDEPLVKKKPAPTEAQIKETITKFLDKANLEEVTMKTVCKKVYETYPDFDLTHKKDFIKTTVKSIIS